METIISSVVTGMVAIVICLLGNSSQAKTTRNMIEFKLEELSKRVDKHNSVIERTYELEKTIEVQEEQIKVANHRISDLENSEKERG